MPPPTVIFMMRHHDRDAPTCDRQVPINTARWIPLVVVQSYVERARMPLKEKKALLAAFSDVRDGIATASSACAPTSATSATSACTSATSATSTTAATSALSVSYDDAEHADHGDSPFCTGYELPHSPAYGAIRDIAAQVLQDDAGLRDEVAKGTLTVRTLRRVVSEQLGVEQLHREDSGCAADCDGFDSDVPATVNEVRALLKTSIVNEHHRRQLEMYVRDQALVGAPARKAMCSEARGLLHPLLRGALPSSGEVGVL